MKFLNWRTTGTIGKRELLILMPMELKEFLEVFSKFYKPSLSRQGRKTINLFYIDSQESIKAILKELVRLGLLADFANKLISNKSKALIVDVKASIESGNIFEMSIYQPRAKGAVIKCFFNLSTIKNYEDNQLLCILYYFCLNLEKNLNIKALKNKNKKGLLDTKNKFLILEKYELELYHKRQKMTDKEREQVLYTYYHYEKQYNYYTEHIDDNKQKAKAEQENTKIIPFFTLCEKCFKKFGFGPL